MRNRFEVVVGRISANRILRLENGLPGIVVTSEMDSGNVKIAKRNRELPRRQNRDTLRSGKWLNINVVDSRNIRVGQSFRASSTSNLVSSGGLVSLIQMISKFVRAVKNDRMAARAKTKASKRRAVNSDIPLSPTSDPTHAPAPAAANQKPIPLGSEPSLEEITANPAIEFRSVKNAEVPAAVRASDHPVRMSKGLRKMPPPMPVRPEIKPIHAPNNDNRNMLGVPVCFDSGGSLNPDAWKTRSEANKSRMVTIN